MKDLLRVALVLALIFASTFVIIQGTGLVTEAGVRAFLADAHAITPAGSSCSSSCCSSSIC